MLYRAEVIISAATPDEAQELLHKAMTAHVVDDGSPHGACPVRPNPYETWGLTRQSEPDEDTDDWAPIVWRQAPAPADPEG